MFCIKIKDFVKNNPFVAVIIILLFAFGCLTFVFSMQTAIVEVLFAVLIALLSFKFYSDETKRKKAEVKTLSRVFEKNADISQGLSDLPFGVILADESGKPIWFNEIFETYIDDMEAKNKKTLNEIFAELLSMYKKDRLKFEFAGEKKKFTVYCHKLENALYAYYFTDDTLLKNIKLEFELTRPVVLLINTDSLEQAEDVMPHDAYYGLISDIERLVSKWLVENNCVYRKFGDCKFFALTELSNLNVMINNRFDLIDKIRQEHFGCDDVDITLSVGVGQESDFSQSESSAREALDMARGRGGDQVALKCGDNYQFFGGISTGKEKRGKVKSRSFAAALDTYIENSSNLLIMGHSFGDFDCIGAAAGIAAIAKAKGKSAFIVANKRTSMAKNMIEMLEGGAAEFIMPEDADVFVKDNTLLVIIDTMRSSILEAPELLKYGMKTVIIDHHRMPVDHIEGNTFELIEPYASSACEMVTELVQYSPSKPKLTPLQAQALLAGIMLDTKNYTLRVSSRTFDAASYLKNCKADTVAAKKLFSGTASENIQVNNTVNSAVYYNGYAISTCTEKSSNSSRLVAAKAADELLSIEGVDASFVIFENGDTVNISARSLERINVQVIMEKLGGGGHHSMAAAQLKNVSENQAFDMLRDAVEDYLNNK